MRKHAFKAKYLVSKFFILIPLNDRVSFDEVNLSKKNCNLKAKTIKILQFKNDRNQEIIAFRYFKLKSSQKMTKI